MHLVFLFICDKHKWNLNGAVFFPPTPSSFCCDSKDFSLDSRFIVPTRPLSSFCLFERGSKLFHFPSAKLEKAGEKESG